jgi:hypothetical protein
MKLTPVRIKRPGTQRIDKLHPAARPGWYKRLRQLTKTSDRKKLR